jgi:hypothetical protein
VLGVGDIAALLGRLEHELAACRLPASYLAWAGILERAHRFGQNASSCSRCPFTFSGNVTLSSVFYARPLASMSYLMLQPAAPLDDAAMQIANDTTP